MTSIAAALLLCRMRRRRRQKRLLLMRLGGSLRERRAIESRALIKDQSDAAWYTMYESRSIPSFIATVSIPPDDFDDLLRVISVHYTVCSGPGCRGRPPRVQQKHAVLAMLLDYYTAAVEHKTLQELFGVSPTTFSRVLRRAEVALDRALSRMQDAAVRWPSKALQRDWAVLTNAKEPLVEGVFAFVDGKNYRVQSPSNADLQNAHYNGRIITPLKEGDLDRNPPRDRLALQTMSDCITSLRQAAEWGMGATGKVYRQLLLLLPYNPLVRGRRLSNMFQLYNLRVRRTGLSQIKNVFGA
ncbi:hypothetical protein H257_17231 [Aphanomyces astaci]|uniref:DDE Tnp4 domain-containing protein n=1 Tax=Aphanomyces astaci TaxID=112090 RepID=W4FFG9_APHAT|nr:hypothetical protein H257_17231 [Aphanomyces astaci]ETV66262.1 hypothetical protein H257_17231 [Aphanomyces astaci]|eukprot:XP_009844249.1 hypothetical protein H257_17231 [Aphanomyces astaci]